jgi:hypothetical protein
MVVSLTTQKVRFTSLATAFLLYTSTEHLF